MPDPTRHVTLMVTHPGGDGHLTLDHHIPVEAADEMCSLVGGLRETRDGGRFVALFTDGAGSRPFTPHREVDDATADRVVAAMKAHMPERSGT